MSPRPAPVIPLRATGLTVVQAPRKYVRLSNEARERLTVDVTALLDFGPPATVDCERLADRYGISLRTVERLVARLREQRPATPRSRRHGRPVAHGLPENALTRVAEHRNCRDAWVAMSDEGTFTGTYDTFLRRLYDAHGRNVVEGAKNGLGAMRYTTYETLERASFMEQYTIDLVHVRAPLRHRGQLIETFAMLVMESSTGVIVSAHIFDTHAVTSRMVASVLGGALRGYDVTVGGQQVRLGGLVDVIQSDNHTVLTSADLEADLATLGVRIKTINSYASNENGQHERLHRSVRSELFAKLPGSSDGPRDRRGELHVTGDPLTLDEARAALTAWMWSHNLDRVDKETKTTPIRRWMDSTAAQPRLPLAAGTKELSVLAMPLRATCQRYKNGVRYNSRHYVNDTLSRLRSKRFDVRVWLDDEDHVELFEVGGAWIGRATDATKMTAAERHALTAATAAERRAVKDVLAGVRDAQNDRIAALARLRTRRPSAPAAPEDADGEPSEVKSPTRTPSLLEPSQAAQMLRKAGAATDEELS